jgi:hypothetical protein
MEPKRILFVDERTASRRQTERCLIGLSSSGRFITSQYPPLPVVFCNQQVSDLAVAKSLSLKELSPRSLIFNKLAHPSIPEMSAEPLS